MSSSTMAVLPDLGSPPSEKLTRDNFLFWSAQVMPSFRGARVLGLLDGTDVAPPQDLEVEDDNNKKKTVPHPAYEVWLA